MTTELTLPQRAAVALGAAEHEKQLTLLVEEAKTITEIKNLDGRTQCHSTLMTLKNARVAITKIGKNAREDAKAFCEAVIAEEKRLIGITEAEETRLQALRDQWDADREAERQAKIEAERQRVKAIRDRIDALRRIPSEMVGMSSSAIGAKLVDLSILTFGDEFAEFTEEARATLLSTMDQLTIMSIKQAEAEAEAARVKAEREELARLRAEAEARRAEDERKAAEARAAQEAELKAAREKQEAELAAQLAEIARQQAEIDRQNAAILADAEAQRKRDEETQAKALAPAAEIAPTPTPAVTEIPVIQHAANTDTGARIKLGEICARIAPLSITAEGLAQLGFHHVATDKSAKLYRAADFPTICMAIARHVEAVAQAPAQAA
jgi:hypothetical protein